MQTNYPGPLGDQLQGDKAKVIISKLEQIKRQFFELASSIDEKLEDFSEYYDKERNEIIKVLNIAYEEPRTTSFLEREKGESSRGNSRIRFTKSTFKDKLINYPIREPVNY